MSSPQQSIVDAVQEIVDRQLKLAEHGHELRPDDDLWALGMSSLNTVGLMLAIEDTFDFEFPDELLSESTFSSVNTISTAVERSQEADHGKSRGTPGEPLPSGGLSRAS